MAVKKTLPKLKWQPVDGTKGFSADLPDGSRLVVGPMMTADPGAMPVWAGWGLILVRPSKKPALLDTFRTARGAMRAGNGCHPKHPKRMPLP